MDHDISLIQALALWVEGDIPRHVTVWGHSLVFWDRLGHVMEFIGAFAVVVDIMGAERLSAIATELREWTRDPAMRPTRMLARPHVALIGIGAISVVAGIAVLTGSQNIDPVLPFTAVPLPAAAAFAVTIVGLALSAYLLLALYFVLFGKVVPPIADYLARVLQNQHADKWLKLVSLPLLTLGFLLDLLSP
jgi:hypothetical protein